MISLGAPYGWSAVSAALAREHGMVVSAATDWSMDLSTYPMSIMMAFGGISAALVGKWQMKVGVRAAMLTGGLCFGSGFMMAAAGVHIHSIGLLYAGAGLSGLGYGFAYTPPIQALINWFPDKKGVASGLVIGGFGSGALFFTPAVNTLCEKFAKLPVYLGNSIDVVVEGGRQFTKIGDNLQEVVFATTNDLVKLPYQGLSEGFYLVGSGSTGVATSLAILGALYTSTILTSALLIKKPADGFLPKGYTPPATAGSGINVPVDNLLRTPQFWLLFSTASLLATGGMGLMSVAKPMIQNVFAGSMPNLVTPGFASAYLMALAAGNLGGRIGWAAVSDRVGRWNTFQGLTFLAIPIFALSPFLINNCVLDPTGPYAPYYLGGFCCSTVLALSVMGGVFSVLPAYEADLFGSKYIGAIHGRFLTFGAVATVVGPTLLLNLRRIAETQAIADLLSKVDPEVFLEKFGVGVDSADSLIQTKTLTISKLMSILPPETIDPSPFLYNNTMYTMAGLVSCASLLHFMVKPVDKKYFEKPV
ncbi:uncharacterized protein LOC111699239 isoform X2 [Eurytemora carolleeae]|uniref:uncharacterized protein LOC111699239 isoform X2 n=1 Tax=Eurytemora carolleeae TaxID=1294199 RepID=UPI000C78F210|nr:uncharacterized protein LOC111699239 isoform X2 [Eurytemora carolleeae]|eukprot:XP_023325629.1 uncharacterized protein LOC111699239 isoform X2 [Eurytemora affinis]